MMIRSIIFVITTLIVLVVPLTHSWTLQQSSSLSGSLSSVSRILNPNLIIRPSLLSRRSSVNKNDDDLPQASTLETEDPCWQTMLDDDCSMGNIYSANFIASKWIQSMPCGEGIEDCDMPTALTAPETRAEAGVEKVDVMSVLGLKRAQSINTVKDTLLP